MPLIPQVGRKRGKVRVLIFSITAFLWLGVLLHLFPVAWMVSASLKPTHEIFEQPFNLIPKHPTTGSYRLLLTTVQDNNTSLNVDVFKYPLQVYLRNSLLIAVLTVLLQ